MPTLTVYIASGGSTVNSEPNNGQPGTSSFGHMWYQVSPDGTSTNAHSFGFAPDPSHNARPFAPGWVYTNDTSNYSANPAAGGTITSYTVSITSAQYNTLMSFGQAGVAADGISTTFSGGGANFNNYYSGLNNSCIDFTWTALSTIGIVEPLHIPGTMLLPTWNNDAVNGALQAFSSSGSQGKPIQLKYDGQGNLLQESMLDSNGNVTSQATFTPGANSETEVLKTGTGAVIATQSGTMDAATGAFTVDAKGINGTGSVVNEQMISTTATDITSGTVTGSGSYVRVVNASITLTPGASATIAGNSNTVSIGDGSSVQIAGSGNGLTIGSNVSLSVTGSADNVTALGSNNLITIGGNGQTATVANDDFVVFSTGQTGNKVTELSNSRVDVSGNGITVNESGNDLLGVGGLANTVNINGSGSSVWIGGGGKWVSDANDDHVTLITGTGDQVYENDNARLDVVGSGLTVNAGNQDNLGVYGSADVVNLTGSNSGVWIGGNGQAATNANDNHVIVTGTSGDQVTESANSRLDVSGNGVVVNEAANDNLGVVGSADIVYLNGTGSNVWIGGNGKSATDANNDHVNASSAAGDQINELDNSRLDVSGSGLSVAAGSNDLTGVVGNNNSVTGGIGDILFMSGSNDAATLSNDTIHFGSGTTASVYGNYDSIYSGTGDTLNIHGIYDPVITNGSTVNYYGANTGDIVYGTGDTGTDWGGFVGGSSGGGGYTGYYGYYGFAGSQNTINAALGADIGSIARNEQSQGHAAAALVAEAGRHQAAVEAALYANNGARATAVLEVAKWDQKVITWSLASTAGTPFSSSIDASYEATVHSAFDAWSKATGVTFREVSDSSASDIRLGWRDLHTAASGVVGYTTFKETGGTLSSALIRLEDPTETALSGSGATATYTGTEAQLQQVLEHEIGHAIGLADDADPTSIMFYELTAKNRSLNQTDLAGAQALYGTSKPTTSSAATDLQLISQAMGSFAPSTGQIGTWAANEELWKNSSPVAAHG